ncbi:MAG TPA: hypothetical protein VIJ66_09130 [Solirubrobacteraceae bacterium]
MSIRRWIFAACLAPFLAALGLALVSLPASAGALPSANGPLTSANGPLTSSAGALTSTAATATSHVDGISDQSLPAWDGGFDQSYFAGLFDDAWVHGPGAHVDFARYVVQWNVMSGDYPRYLGEFEAWLDDVASIELKPEIALTSYDGSLPASPREYEFELVEILGRARALGHPIAWLEAWNEPNGQGGEPAAEAAAFTNAASSVCEGEGDCTVIAGDFEDSPGVAAYEDEYVKDLHPVPANWGVHPYYSVEEESETPFETVREHLPNGGKGARIWFTEVAARRCTDFAGRLVENGEAGQARRADWLVNTLMRNARPVHVFYYELLLRAGREPSCETEGSDSALYVPSGDPAEPDSPRRAAAYVWGDGGGSAPGEAGEPGEPGDAFLANAAQATLTGGAEL